MPKLGTAVLKGKSGKTYTMNVYPGRMRFNDFIPGVYFISREDTGSSQAIFLGESDNVDIALIKHEQKAAFIEQGFNRISFLRNASKDVRESVVADLLPVLKPTCNT